MIVGGSTTVPGDKSLTHRLLFLASLAPGTSRLRGALTSLDAKSTASVLRALGAEVSSLRPGGEVLVQGRRAYRRPTTTLDCGNSGTTARLGMGLIAAHSFRARVTGDRSLRNRPMKRITEPLTAMGARFEGANPDRLPLVVKGGGLRGLEWKLPVSSAQIKGCLLFAGLAARCPVSVLEPFGRSRDHTERLLRSFGYRVDENDEGWVRFAPTGALHPFDLEVPGDPSSAAFLVGAAVLAESGNLRIEGVGLNPTRTGFLRVLERMGARIELEARGDRCGEPVGTIVVWPSELRGTVVVPAEIPGLIDEIPLLAVLASRARGETIFHNVGELRVKESDRLGLLAKNLRAVGAKATVTGDTLAIEGTSRPAAGRVVTEADHRIAMAFAALGTVDGARVRVDNLACSAVSFPGFQDTLRRIRAGRIRRAS